MKTGRSLFHGSLILFCLALLPVAGQESDLSAACRILGAHYIDPSAVKVQPGDNLSKVLARLHGGACLIADPVVMPARPDISMLLPGNILFSHVPSFAPLSPDSTYLATLQQQLQQQPSGVILDLRENESENNFMAGVAVASCFIPANTVLFSTKGEGTQVYRSHAPGPVYRGPIIVLVNGQTSGVAEVLARCLRSHGALILGSPTSGNAALFQEDRLPSGQMLRYVTGSVTLPGGAPLLGSPLQPDLEPEIAARQEAASLQLIEHGEVLSALREGDGHRKMNEAALVHQENPEYDDYLAQGKKAPLEPLVQDVALIRALDSLKAIQVTQRAVGLVQNP